MADFELQGMPVWVYSKDADSKASIAPSRLVEGTVGEHFSLDPADVAGYRFVSSEGTLTGTFDELQTTFDRTPTALKNRSTGCNKSSKKLA